MFLGGDLYRGYGGFAGEIGHTKVVPDRRSCHCGASGCLSAYLSLSKLLDRASAVGARVLTLETLEAQAAAGDPKITTICHESGYLLGLAIANIMNSINPPAVLITGTFARLWPHLREGFDEALNLTTLSAPLSQTRIMVSKTPPDSAPMGGIAIALHGATTTAQLDGIP